MERLLEFAERELNEVGPVKFRVQRVLENAEVSKSSAYHHFGNRDGLIAAVEIRNVSQQIKENNRLFRYFFENTDVNHSATELLRILVNFSADQSGVEARKRRAATLVAARNSPELSHIIARTQCEGAEYLAETLGIGVERGWIAPVMPLLGISHWLMASIFGRILIDFTGDEAANEAWSEAAYLSLSALLRPLS
jgi:AcrR family transcriptional regulator